MAASPAAPCATAGGVDGPPRPATTVVRDRPLNVGIACFLQRCIGRDRYSLVKAYHPVIGKRLPRYWAASQLLGGRFPALVGSFPAIRKRLPGAGKRIPSNWEAASQLLGSVAASQCWKAAQPLPSTGKPLPSYWEAASQCSAGKPLPSTGKRASQCCAGKPLPSTGKPLPSYWVAASGVPVLGSGFPVTGKPLPSAGKPSPSYWVAASQ